LLRGISFYDLFIDRRRWPELIRQGYVAARQALEAFGVNDAGSGRRRATKHLTPTTDGSRS
jgi:hypothetical protein